MTKAQAIFNRFLKGFIGSTIATLLAALIGIGSFNNFDDFKAFCMGLIVPIVTGALLALQKAYSWEEPETPVDIEGNYIKGTSK